MPTERDLTGFTGMLAPLKLIQPLETEGRNIYSCLSISLGVFNRIDRFYSWEEKQSLD